MKIASRNIGPDYPPYMVAEISANHGGSVAVAKDLVVAARESGAHAVKIQCYTADTICAREGHNPTIIGEGLWQAHGLYELYKKAETPPAMAKEILQIAKEAKITCFSSVFDTVSLDFLVKLGVPAIKIASFELVDIRLIGIAAGYGLPMIVSTGMGTHDEIAQAVAAVRRGRGTSRAGLALLHCVSDYPTKPSDARLGLLGPLKEMHGVDTVGFSDHTLGVGTACAAVGFGAAIIEKHFILDRKFDVPDAAFSLEPAEFRVLSAACRDAWEAVSDQNQRGYRDQPANRAYRKSLWVTSAVKAGDIFSGSNVGILRPASGLAPSLYGSVLGAKATRDLPANTPLSRDMVSALA
jgi:N-acetylneuraminate synthase